MNKIDSLLDQVTEVKNICTGLIVIAHKFLQSKDPAVRALGYEISVNVSNIISEQKNTLKKINGMIEGQEIVT